LICITECEIIDVAFQKRSLDLQRKEIQMPKMTFSSENKKNTETFPKLKLAQNETARIAIFELPDVGFVHNLRAPKMINGVVQYKSGKDGKEEMDFDFVSNPICLGDFETLEERGMDPKNCPACKAASENPDMFQKPKRRFAMHVFQYATNGTSKPTKTFQGEVKVWSFTDQKYGEIADLAEEAPEGDIKNVDLILGPCENAMFQKYKIIASTQVKHSESDATEKQFAEIIEENKAPSLDPYLGRVVKKLEYLEDDLDKVRTKWRQASGQGAETNSDNLVGAERNLDAGLADLGADILEAPKPAVKNTETSDGPVDFDALLNDI
jgi:hypothetical protein